MDFNELLKKYNNNTATAEEVDFIESTVKQAREVARTRLKNDKHVSVLKKVKNFFIRLFVFLIIIAAVAGYGYLKIADYAKENIVMGKYAADSAAKAFVVKDLGLLDTQVDIYSSQRKLVFVYPFDRSYYMYEYTISTSNRGNYYLTIDSYSELIEYVNE